jgi:hypothetical protein
MTRDSSVSVAKSYGLDCRSSILGAEKRFFSTPQRPGRLWGIPSFLSNGYGGLFPSGLKRSGREADHLPRPTVQVKNCGVVPPLQTYLHGMLLN